MLRTNTNSLKISLRSIQKCLLNRRFMATQTSTTIVKPEITNLSNGVTVATEHDPSAKTSSVGLVFDSGSTSENPYNNGVSNFWSHIFKQHINKNSKTLSEGLQLNSKISKDYQSYIIDSLPNKVSNSLDFLQENFINLHIDDSMANSFHTIQKDVINELQTFESKDHPERVMEHLYSTAFQNTPLSLPTRGTIESIKNLELQDLQAFAKDNFRSANAMIVGTGNIPHEQLVEQVESKINLLSGSKLSNNKKQVKSTFLGSEVRLRDDTLPKAWISIAVEGEPLNSPNYYTAKVASEIFGSYNAFEPRSRLQGIKLLDNLQEYHLCDSFNHFSLSNKDSGLWGFSTITSNVNAIDDLIHFTLKQWNRLTISITSTELERGKSLLKLKLAKQLNPLNTSNMEKANILAKDIFAMGRKPTLDEIFTKIDSITVKDIKAWAGEKVWDQDIAIAGTGQIEGLLDYMRIRNDMSMMRW
ncbi:ubiquinol--cytochrome-c reductase subunit COR1 NDAI_0J00570 [Naumovozyma dairenensis CBS 421]|uniref:Peptidase M16 C-terminal domain-containing protein n=1 Tax=Naumovozyma dairenensis (strain ATCC 10597 / BCRC 20456 / CBS 421 / NBRC 0211 / NRRL Y-12639) TaxID=1071378 RepID=G0WGM1_NAUDC|nr:hypothetical protein NDAI_0J00570 [Naumovozyma dairenensis CBS 421]CCD26949.1 hypothetical protein NDAI_0J00570 [Naumovozyma dairenensis CBS 421]